MERIVPRESNEYLRYLIIRAGFFLIRTRRLELARYHISPHQVYLLSILYTLGRGTTLKELSWQTDRKINTLSVNMTKMERLGLVKKVRPTPNSIHLSYELEEKGIETHLKCQKPKAIKEIMSVLSEEENQQLKLILGKIVNKAEKYKLEKVPK